MLDVNPQILISYNWYFNRASHDLISMLHSDVPVTQIKEQFHCVDAVWGPQTISCAVTL